MHVTHPRIWIATFVVFAATLSAREAHADSKNEIRAVTFDDDGATTRVNVRGATTPTFTVYKLERPSRVVIDVPQARLGEALRGHEGAATYTPSTWAVSNPKSKRALFQKLLTNSKAPARNSVEPATCAMTNRFCVRDRRPPAAASWRIDRIRLARVAWIAGASAGRTPAIATRTAVNAMSRPSTPR